MLSSVRFNKTKRNFICASRLLPAERAALSQTGLATGGLAEDGRAAGADNDGLGVREDGGDGEASGALDVHEEGAGLGHKGLHSDIQVSVLFILPGTGFPSHRRLVVVGGEVDAWDPNPSPLSTFTPCASDIGFGEFVP